MSSARKSSAYIMASTFISKGIAFIGSIFIARLLFPEDFGYIVFAEIISAFIMLVANCGFENFYLQEKIRDKQHEAEILGVTYKLRLVFNSALFFLQVGISYLAQYKFGEEIVGIILRVSALGHLLNAITISRQYVLRKRLDFRIESVGNVARDVVATVAKVGFAFTGLGAVSIAMGAVVGGVTRTIIFLAACRDLPMAKSCKKDIVKRVWHFGIYSFLSNFVGYFCNYIDKMLLTATFPMSGIGLYAFGSSRAAMVRAYTTVPLGVLVISWIAKHKGNTDGLLDKIAKMSYLEISIIMPIICLLFGYADYIIPSVFGSKWAFAVPFFQMFLVLSFVQALTGNLTSIFTGLGYPRLQFLFAFSFFVCIGGSLFFVSRSGNLFEYALTYVAACSAFDFLKGHFCARKINASLLSYLKRSRCLDVLLWSGINGLTIWLIKQYTHPSLLALICSALAVILIFIVQHMYLRRAISVEIIKLVAPRLHEKFLKVLRTRLA